MDATPSTSAMPISPPRKRTRKQGYLSFAEKQYIINNHKKMQVEYPNLGTTALVSKIADTMGLAESTIYRVISEYKSTGQLTTPQKQTGRHSLIETFDESVKNRVRRIIHSFFYKNEAPTLNKILFEIKEQADIPQMSRSTLYKLMKQINFKYMTRNRKSLLIERDEIIRWRRRYLTAMKAYRLEGRPIYYLDETWLNEGHTKGKVWIDTNIKSKRQAFIEGLSMGLKNPSGKGRRLIILHIGSVSGFVENCLLVFEGTKSTDYHQEMNAAIFEDWFGKMIGKLPQNAVIVMDNASYHSRRAEKIPTTCTRKKDMQEWLKSKNIAYNEIMVRSELLHLIQVHKEKYNKYVTDEMAKKHGKIVLRLPPYHCELNPIELVWAQIKNEVASKNTTFKLADVKHLLEEAIQNVDSAKWENCIGHVIKEENKMFQLDGLMDDVQEPFIISLGNDSETSLSEESESD